MPVSPQRRLEIMDSLRRGTVPRSSLDAFAVGLDRFEGSLNEELQRVTAGGSVFKAVRGEYGCGKTFFARWLADRARKLGFATSEVQISETETPLHRLETVYRRLMERLSTVDTPQGAVKNIVDGWFYTLEEDVLAEGSVAPGERGTSCIERTSYLLEKRLAKVNEVAPTFSAALRGYRQAQVAGEQSAAEGLLAWISGQPNVSAAAKRFAGVKGDIDHFGAMSFLQGVLTVLRDSGHPGLLVVLDEVETIQRVRSDVRDKSLNALRQLIDEVDSGRFPGLYLMITGTPAFFDGPQGIRRLEPLAQRLHVDFETDPRFDNPRAVQIRLPGFDLDRLALVGCRIRDIYREHCPTAERVRRVCDDALVANLAGGVAGKLGGKVGVAPRIFLKKLVGDVLDRIDQFEDFDPRDPLRTDDERSGAQRRGTAGDGCVGRRGNRAGTVSHFDRLHPALQHHIVNSLGWRELRPFQDAVIPRILDGEHLVILAPTAGGKTEAAFLPVLSRMLSEDWTGLSVLYLCPIKALLNNLESRLTRYCAFRRQASDSLAWRREPGARKRIQREPPDCVLTTPESLEVMLVSPNVDSETCCGRAGGDRRRDSRLRRR